MKTNQLFLLTGLVAVTLPACVQKDKKGVSEKPMNILYIMCDDHSYQTISAYDHRFIETPNIDRIANEGVRFTNSFVANSLSGPSRACLLTGKHSHKNGFTDNTKRFDGSQQTFPKLLQQAGYQTAVVGKWHLTSDPTGFDYWNILIGQGDYYNPYFIDNGEKKQIEGYATNITTDLALDWLDNKRDKNKPFCLLLHHKAPHRTWMPDTCDLDLYEDVVYPVPETFYDKYEGRIAASEQEMNIIKDMDLVYDLKMADKENEIHTTTGLEENGRNLYNRMTPAQKPICPWASTTTAPSPAAATARTSCTAMSRSCRSTRRTSRWWTASPTPSPARWATRCTSPPSPPARRWSSSTLMFWPSPTAMLPPHRPRFPRCWLWASPPPRP